ncbi:uncharacterized protein LOC135463089 [Liolophura sinensis]|uniref:uncharacterized protein LOC135463089 n=1 Tax=Liolophura sinensis TaxID=3198878 RepID=UPI00315898C5
MTSRSVNAVFLIVCSLFRLTSGNFDQTVCSSAQPGAVSGGPSKPNFPDQFQTRIELTIINKNQTTELVEYYDGANNRGTIQQTDFNINLRAIYDYVDDEFIMDFPDEQRCQVTSLDSTDQRFLLGYQMVNGKGRIFSAARALHWSDPQIQENYVGTDVVRGIIVDHWQSCQYWADEDASMQVHWYFTANNAWGTSIGRKQLPVRCWVKGIVNKQGETPHNFEHYYEFFQFRDTIIDGVGVFEAPMDYPCPGRINTKSLPVPSKAFSFMSEVVNYDTKEISYMKEEFDLKTKLVRYIYKPPTAHQVIEIHDFNTGVAYVNDPLVGNCTYKPIESGGFDVKNTDSAHVRMRTANEFFSFDNTRYTYIGKHKERLIDCDAWVATRTDWPPGLGVNSTWTWYFATTDWIEASGNLLEDGEPISLKVEIPSYNMHMQYNMYNFFEGEPDIFEFDVSNCYAFRDRVYVTFILPGVYNDFIQKDRSIFKYSLLLTITGVAGVSPVRIAHLNFVMSDTNVTVEFEVLDVAPKVGDVQSTTQEVPLFMAVAAINDTIAAGQFVIRLLGDEEVYLVAIQDSLQTLTYVAGTAQPDSQSAHYTPGAMAAIGITMPIVGGIIGAVAAFFFFK